MNSDESNEASASNTSPANAWEVQISGFATAVGKTVEEVTSALESLTGPASDSALEVLNNPDAVRDEDLQHLFVDGELKIPLGLFRAHLSKLRRTKPAIEIGESFPSQNYDLLPAVPEEDSFLEMLKVGGVLKVGKTEIISAAKAAIASTLGIYDLPATILRRMEQFAQEQSEPVGQDFYKLQSLMTSRKYGEILSALGVSGTFVSERRKRELLDLINAHLWNSLRGFHTQLDAWQSVWTKGMSNPGLLLASLAFGKSGQNIMPPGMMSPPETDSLRDAAEAVIEKINGIFAGTGIPVSRALAYDATKIRAVLEEPALPAATGFANKDQMLKGLGLAVGSDFVRLERNVTRFALGVMEFPKVAPGNEELGYLAALLQLGASIPWDKLPTSGASVRTRRTGNHLREEVEEEV